MYHIKERILNRILREKGLSNLSSAQIRILKALWVQDDIPVWHLAQQVALDRSTLSLSLKRMEQNHLIQRREDDADKRVVRIRLTEQGNACRLACREAADELISILYRGIEQEKIELFTQVLQQVLKNITALDELEAQDKSAATEPKKK